MRIRCAALALLAAVAARGGDEPLLLHRSIPLEDVKGRIDHMALSAAGDILVVAALANDTVEIVDVKEGARIHRIRDVGKPTGVALSGDRFAVASGRDGKLHFHSARTFERVLSVDVGPDADNVRVEVAGVEWVGCGDGALVCVEKGGKWFEVPLAAHPESFQLESAGTRIFVNVPGAGHVAVVDREKRKVVATWKLDVKDNFPMALDEARARLLVGCRTPPRLLVLDTADGRLVASLEISGDVDDLFVDAKVGRIYASSGEGFVDVISIGEKDGYRRTARVATSPGARTCLFDAKEGRLFVAAPQHGGKSAEIRVYRRSPP